jgi:hypothetical protein
MKWKGEIHLLTADQDSLLITRFYLTVKDKQKQTPWLESASELYRPSDRRLSAHLVPTFADRGRRVVSATDPHGCNLGFLYLLLSKTAIETLVLRKLLRLRIYLAVHEGKILQNKKKLLRFEICPCWVVVAVPTWCDNSVSLEPYNVFILSWGALMRPLMHRKYERGVTS